MYFLSDTPCAMFINGAFFGRCDGFARFTELSLKDNLFICFQPENALPISFFLNDNIRFSPPSGCEVYLLDNAIAVYARRFPAFNQAYTVHTQARFDDVLFTVFSQGMWQVAVNSQNTFLLDELPFAFEHPTLCALDDFVLLESPRAVAVYTKDGKRLLCLRALSYERKNELLTVRLAYLSQTYTLISGEVLLTETIFTGNPPLAYTFCCKLLNGGNPREMLCDELADGIEEIRAYLGDFCAVEPTDDPFVCVLISKRSEGIFSVTRCSVKTKDGKIEDFCL